MKNHSYKIAVFSDLKDPQQYILRNSISLAKKIDGEIEFFHVKKPREVVKTDNQLSAKRTINRTYAQTDNAIQELIAALSEEHQIRIRHSFALGNIKSEISEFLEQSKPDVVVLGRRKSGALKLLGDGITAYVLKNFSGPVMISTEHNSIGAERNLSLGLLNSDGQVLNTPLAEKLLKQAKAPLKSFTVKKGAKSKTKDSELAGISSVDYVFEHNDNAINNLSQYISKSKVDLLFVERNPKKSWDSSVRKAISDINVNVMMASR